MDAVLAGSYHASLRRARQSGGRAEYRDASFSARAKTFSMTLPRLHLVAMNRSTTYRQRSARAFQKMFDSIRKTVAVQGSALPDSFSHPPDKDVFLEIPDAHTSSHRRLALGDAYWAVARREVRSGWRGHTTQQRLIGTISDVYSQAGRTFVIKQGFRAAKYFRKGITSEMSQRRVLLGIPPFKPGAGSAQAGIHVLDSPFRGNDDGVGSASMSSPVETMRHLFLPLGTADRVVLERTADVVRTTWCRATALGGVSAARPQCAATRSRRSRGC